MSLVNDEYMNVEAIARARALDDKAVPTPGVASGTPAPCTPS